MCNETIDLVKLLGDCPKGTKLYSPILGEVTLDRVDNDDCMFPIYVEASDGGVYCFTKEGYYYEITPECLLFPSKEQRDWSKFIVYKEGDFLATKDGRAFIFKVYTIDGYPIAYGGVDTCGNFIPGNFGGNYSRWTSSSCRKATDEEIRYMIKKMVEAGYIWDAENKIIRKDLPVGTLVAVSDKYALGLVFPDLSIRRYAGSCSCILGLLKTDSYRKEWKVIIPLDKLKVSDNGLVQINKEDNYGTDNC